MRIIYLIIFNLFNIVLGLAQEPKEMILNTVWKTTFNNTLEISNDSVYIDHHKYLRDGIQYDNTYHSKLTNSSFLLIKDRSDTLLNFTYSVNKDSLKIDFLPVETKRKGSHYKCNFYYEPFCHLMGKSAIYYSPNYLYENVPKFNFDSIIIRNEYFDLELTENGMLSFYQKKFDSHTGSMMRNDNIVTVGFYQGDLGNKLIDSIDTIIISNKLLKQYLFTDQKPLFDKDDYIPSYIKINWDSSSTWIDNGQIYQLIINEFKNQLLDSNNFSYYQIKGKSSPKPVRYYTKNFQSVIRGKIDYLDSISTQDTTVFIYQMQIDSIYQNTERRKILPDTSYFISEHNLNHTNETVLISYYTKVAGYQDLNNKGYSVKYNVVDKVFDLETHIVFDFLLRKQREEIVRMPVRSDNYYKFNNNRFFIETIPRPPSSFPSEFDYKIVKKLKELKGIKFLDKMKQEDQ